MSVGFKITCSVPMKGEEVIISNDIFFLGEDGLYHLPAGKHTIPMPMWDKLTISAAKPPTGRGGS